MIGGGNWSTAPVCTRANCFGVEGFRTRVHRAGWTLAKLQFGRHVLERITVLLTATGTDSTQQKCTQCHVPGVHATPPWRPRLITPTRLLPRSKKLTKAPRPVLLARRNRTCHNTRPQHARLSHAGKRATPRQGTEGTVPRRSTCNIIRHVRATLMPGSTQQASSLMAPPPSLPVRRATIRNTIHAALHRGMCPAGRSSAVGSVHRDHPRPYYTSSTPPAGVSRHEAANTSATALAHGTRPPLTVPTSTLRAMARQSTHMQHPPKRLSVWDNRAHLPPKSELDPCKRRWAQSAVANAPSRVVPGRALKSRRASRKRTSSWAWGWGGMEVKRGSSVCVIKRKRGCIGKLEADRQHCRGST